jgi:hypothetical protein
MQRDLAEHDEEDAGYGQQRIQYDQKQQRRHQHLERVAGDQANLRSRYKWRGLSKVHLWGLTAGR